MRAGLRSSVSGMAWISANVRSHYEHVAGCIWVRVLEGVRGPPGAITAPPADIWWTCSPARIASVPLSRYLAEAVANPLSAARARYARRMAADFSAYRTVNPGRVSIYLVWVFRIPGAGIAAAAVYLARVLRFLGGRRVDVTALLRWLILYGRRVRRGVDSRVRRYLPRSGRPGRPAADRLGGRAGCRRR